MYCDCLGNEIKVGQIVGISRYGRQSSLEFGIVISAAKTKSTHYVNCSIGYFNNGYQNWSLQNLRAKIKPGINRNIAIMQAPASNDYNCEVISKLNKGAELLITYGKLPADYVLGQVMESEGGIVAVSSKGTSAVVNDKGTKDILSSLGAPKSLMV